MGQEKPLAVLEMFRSWPTIQTIILSDVDVAWMRDPAPWLRARPAADAFVTTDCLSHRSEVLDLLGPRCGHLRGALGVQSISVFRAHCSGTRLRSLAAALAPLSAAAERAQHWPMVAAPCRRRR